MGMNFYATGGTARFMAENKIEAKLPHWPLEEEKPNVLEYLRTGKIERVINIPKNYQEEELTNDYIIRRTAVDFAVPLFTNVQLARQFVEALSRKTLADLQIKSWKEYR
jgi:carbamoyl-phosphate synthase large subunit